MLNNVKNNDFINYDKAIKIIKNSKYLPMFKNYSHIDEDKVFDLIFERFCNRAGYVTYEDCFNVTYEDNFKVTYEDNFKDVKLLLNVSQRKLRYFLKKVIGGIVDPIFYPQAVEMIKNHPYLEGVNKYYRWERYMDRLEEWKQRFYEAVFDSFCYLYNDFPKSYQSYEDRPHILISKDGFDNHLSEQYTYFVQVVIVEKSCAYYAMNSKGN